MVEHTSSSDGQVPRWLRAIAGNRVATVDAAPRCEVAMVLGAKLVSPATPSHMLADRLETALALLRRGRADRLLVSGEGGARGEDEVGPMRRYLLDRGAAAESLMLDGEGARTLASLVRARDVFGLRELLVVTTDFHVPRVLYLARRLGIEVVAVPARARRSFSRRTLARNLSREAVAQLRAFWDVGLRGRR